MSYAARLVNMTGRANPAARPLVHDIVESTNIDPVTPPPIANPAAEPAARSPERSTRVAAPAHEPASQVIEPARPDEEIRELTRIVEMRLPVAPPTSHAPSPMMPAPAAPPIVRHEVVHEWLAERGDDADPLESLPADDELRELLRAVRGWTGAPAPTSAETGEAAPIVEVVETHAIAPHAPHAPHAPQSQVMSRADEPVQVSIGNVTITIEDAPAPARPHRPPAPAVDVQSRLERHYWRGR